jgi:hypothetical protein
MCVIGCVIGFCYSEFNFTMQELAVTTQIHRFVMLVVTDRSLARWIAVAATVVAALVLNAPIGGGTGA